MFLFIPNMYRYCWNSKSTWCLSSLSRCLLSCPRRSFFSFFLLCLLLLLWSALARSDTQAGSGITSQPFSHAPGRTVRTFLASLFEKSHFLGGEWVCPILNPFNIRESRNRQRKDDRIPPNSKRRNAA